MTIGQRQAMMGAIRQRMVEAQLRLDEATKIFNHLANLEGLESKKAPEACYLSEPECVE